MVDLISVAYGIYANEILGGPSWLEMNRYDVIAKLPTGTTQDVQKEMLKALLAERFGAVVHSESKPMPALALTAGKKTQLKEPATPGEPNCDTKFQQAQPRGTAEGGAAPGAAPMMMASMTLTVDCRNMTMDRFSSELRDMGDFEDKPILDHTGIKGAWDFSFKYTPSPRMNSADNAPLIEAVEKQLGLKVEQAKLPINVVVVDRVNVAPSPNVPDIAQILKISPPPTEFEIADVKPTNPDFKGRRLQIQRGGRVNISGTSLKFLIMQAWNLTEEMLIGAPKWLDDDRWDIIAKASSTKMDEDIDIEQMWPLMQALLKDRFKLQAHLETRPVPAYTLTAVKPKMQKADPTARTRFKEGPGSDGKDPRNANAVLSRLVTIQNMTMDQFAQELQHIAGGYIKSAVLNSTGLSGSYDFTLSFSPVMAVNGRGAAMRDGLGAPAVAPGEASDPSGAVSLFEAINRQLGLKLELEKRPLQVLVIDHIEQKPTEN